MAGKHAMVTLVVDSMTDNLRPTRAEATDVANVVLDGCDAILRGAETLRGLYPAFSNFCLLAETPIAKKLIPQKYVFMFKHNGIDTKVEKSRKQMKECKSRAKNIRGVKKTKAGDAARLERRNKFIRIFMYFRFCNLEDYHEGFSVFVMVTGVKDLFLIVKVAQKFCSDYS